MWWGQNEGPSGFELRLQSVAACTLVVSPRPGVCTSAVAPRAAWPPQNDGAFGGGLRAGLRGPSGSQEEGRLAWRLGPPEQSEGWLSGGERSPCFGLDLLESDTHPHVVSVRSRCSCEQYRCALRRRSRGRGAPRAGTAKPSGFEPTFGAFEAAPASEDPQQPA